MKIWISRDFANGMYPDEASVWVYEPINRQGTYSHRLGPIFESAREETESRDLHPAAAVFMRECEPGQCKCFKLKEIK
jgi:hypothetical protein